MNRIDRCWEDIEAIRWVGYESEAAYVARSRIGRLVLSVSRLVAQEVGAPRPDLPGRIDPPETCSPMLQALSASCNRIQDLSRGLVQPSEPLDERWKRGWSALTVELDSLASILMELRQGT